MAAAKAILRRPPGGGAATVEWGDAAATIRGRRKGIGPPPLVVLACRKVAHAARRDNLCFPAKDRPDEAPLLLVVCEMEQRLVDPQAASEASSSSDHICCRVLLRDAPGRRRRALMDAPIRVAPRRHTRRAPAAVLLLQRCRRRTRGAQSEHDDHHGNRHTRTHRPLPEKLTHPHPFAVEAEAARTPSAAAAMHVPRRSCPRPPRTSMGRVAYLLPQHGPGPSFARPTGAPVDARARSTSRASSSSSSAPTAVARRQWLMCQNRSRRNDVDYVRRRGQALPTTTRLLWVVAAAIVVVWLVLVLVGAATT
jgi:hypothetical protein